MGLSRDLISIDEVTWGLNPLCRGAFEHLGAKVDYNDPHVPATHKMRRHDLKMESVAMTPEALRGYDCVLIATHHSAYDWQLLADHSQLIVDTRNAMNGITAPTCRIVKA